MRPNLGYFPPVGRSRIILSSAEIAKSHPLFLSSCVSASRHREERLDTLSRKGAFSKVDRMTGEGDTHIVFSPLKVVNAPYGERGYDDGSYQGRLCCTRHLRGEGERTRDEKSASMLESSRRHRTMPVVDHVRYHNGVDIHNPP